MSRQDELVDVGWVEAYLHDPQVVLVEVDENATAYERDHIHGAVYLEWRKGLQNPDRRDFVNKEQFKWPYAVVRRSGYRSSVAVNLLASSGRPVLSGLGGMTAWNTAGYSMMTGDSDQVDAGRSPDGYSATGIPAVDGRAPARQPR